MNIFLSLTEMELWDFSVEDRRLFIYVVVLCSTCNQIIFLFLVKPYILLYNIDICFIKVYCNAYLILWYIVYGLTSICNHTSDFCLRIDQDKTVLLLFSECLHWF